MARILVRPNHEMASWDRVVTTTRDLLDAHPVTNETAEWLQDAPGDFLVILATPNDEIWSKLNELLSEAEPAFPSRRSESISPPHIGGGTHNRTAAGGNVS